MNAQSPIMTLASTPNPQTIQGKPAGSVIGKPNSATTEGITFASVLDGQTAGEALQTTDKPDNQTLSLLGILQMLQSLTLPVTGDVKTGAQEQGTADSLPGVLVQLMNADPAFAQSMLLDPNMQQWLTQAAGILQALSGPANGQQLLTGIGQTQALTTGFPSQMLQAQHTLLQLASDIQQQPQNPIFRQLVQELQQVIQPKLQSELTTNLAADATPQTGNGAAHEMLQTVNGQNGPISAMSSDRNGLKNRSAKPEPVNGLEVYTTKEGQLQQTKAKLELLAAKSALVLPTNLSEQAIGGGMANMDLDSGASDAPLLQNPVFPLQELLKTLQQAEVQAKDLPQATVSAQQFVQEMSQFMLKNMKVTLSGSFSEAKLSLHPENLGHVDVKLIMHNNGQLVAQFAADTLAGKQLLESQLPQLKQALQSQGLQVEKLEVTQNQTMQSGMFQEHRQQQSGQPSSRQARTRLPEVDSASDDFSQELLTIAQLRNAAYANSFDVTA